MSVDIKNSVLGKSTVVSTGQKSLDLDINKKNHERKKSNNKPAQKAETKVEIKKEQDEEVRILILKKKNLENEAEDPKNQIHVERDPLKLLKVV
ncbi:MAG: hypothetical protein WC635_13870 [Bacteriovorax sp.]|jgi:hypothetical protein